jgi:hypothetical protein
VLAVNRARGVADLMPAAKGAQMEKDVPLTAILPLSDNSPGRAVKEPSSKR